LNSRKPWTFAMNMPPLPHGIQESRLTLLRELSDALAQGQAALLASDLEGFDREITRQQDLCLELLHLQSLMEGRSLAGTRGRAPSPEGPAQNGHLPDDARSLALRQAERRLWHQALLYAAVLRRTGRTVAIFCRVLANSGTTYAAPAGGR
jgi:hypothetical protein